MVTLGVVTLPWRRKCCASLFLNKILLIGQAIYTAFLLSAQLNYDHLAQLLAKLMAVAHGYWICCSSAIMAWNTRNKYLVCIDKNSTLAHLALNPTDTWLCNSLAEDNVGATLHLWFLKKTQNNQWNCWNVLDLMLFSLVFMMEIRIFLENCLFLIQIHQAKSNGLCTVATFVFSLMIQIWNLAHEYYTHDILNCTLKKCYSILGHKIILQSK